MSGSRVVKIRDILESRSKAIMPGCGDIALETIASYAISRKIE
jgi:hypothetical protein